MASAVRPFPVWRLRAVVFAVLLAGNAIYMWLLLAHASPRSAALWHAAVIGALTRTAIGTTLLLVVTHAVLVRDRRLAEYATSLEDMVAQRTRALDLRGRGMRLVLDNVDQGLLTIDVHGVMDAERSAMIERWLGPAPAGTTFGALVGARAPGFAVWLDLGLEALREGVMPLDVVLAQLPRRFTTDGAQFAVTYSPILERERVHRILVVIRNVTAAGGHERAERGERELMVVFQRIASDRAGLEQLLEETGELVTMLEHPGDPLIERRLLHTLKGDCLLNGLDAMAELCHVIEEELAQVRPPRPLTREQRERLRDGWRELVARTEQLLGTGVHQVVELDRRELLATVEHLRLGHGHRDLAGLLLSWTHEPVARRFVRLALHARQLARRLGKGEIEVAVRDGGLRLDAARWKPFWRGLLHAVTNAVDHGLEPAALRVLAGKPARGLLALAARATPRGLEITLSDDGRGIEWDAVHAHALDAGLPCANAAELEAALFHDGLTTRDEVTPSSGRGVGLPALRDAVRELGGTIEIASTPLVGTTFTFVFPGGMALAPAAASLPDRCC